MKKFNVISYLVGISLGLFLFSVLLNFSFYVENIQEEVVSNRFSETDHLMLLVWHLFFIGVLFVVSSFQSNLYIKNPDDQVSLYFSVYCWTIIAGTILGILPYGHWLMILKLSYICTYLSLLSFHLYIQAYMNKKVHPLLDKVLWRLIVIVIGLTLLTNVETMVFLMKFMSFLSIGYFFYILYLSMLKLKEKTIQSVGNVVSLFLLSLALLHDELIGYGVLEGESTFGVGLMTFLLLHSALNMDRFLTFYAETIEMKRILEEKVKARTIELEKANEEMRHLQDEKRQTIADICHDLSSPLASISMVSKGLIDGILPMTDPHYIDEILNRSKVMEKLLSDLRQLNMLESDQMFFQMKKTDWYSFMEQLFTNHRANVQSEGINYQLHVEKRGEASVSLDPYRMEQVFSNLLSNSIKYTPEGGTIHVKVGIDQDHQQAMMTIADTGVGIASHHLPHIYDRFYKTNPLRMEKESSGLGLNIVHSIITKHQGSIEVESETGKGTAFTIRLPLNI